MKGKYRTDSLLGTSDVGGLVHATVYCPIFDPRPKGNFTPSTESGFKIEPFDPFKDPGFVYILNILTLPYYEISSQYTITDDGYAGRNFNELIKVTSELRARSRSSQEFSKRIITRVRLGQIGDWGNDARKYIMMVTTPTFGQIIPDESIGYPVIPVAHSGPAREALKTIAIEISDLKASTKKRTQPNASR